MKNNFNIFIIPIICALLIAVICNVYFNHSDKETFYEDAQHQIVTDNVIEKNGIYEDYENINFKNNYATLGNGSVQKINEIAQQVIDRVNINSKLIIFNQAIQPVENCKINQQEFDDYGKFLVDMLNKVMDYTCFKFINVIPTSKLKTLNQKKHTLTLNELYNHPDDTHLDNKKPLHLSFVTSILFEQSYTECGEICGEQTSLTLTPDYVEGSGQTYIDAFMLLPGSTIHNAVKESC